MTTPRPRVVLDTNACLDLWVFADPRAAGLRAALQTGALHAITNPACRDEWLRVLHYRQLRLTDAERSAPVATFDALVDCRSDEEAPLCVDARVPRCADPDDQKFLELARACGARWLISRDTAVLALGRRTRRDGLFEIVSPQAWANARP